MARVKRKNVAKVLFSVLLWLLIIVVLIGAIMAIKSLKEDYYNDKEKYNFRYGFIDYVTGEPFEGDTKKTIISDLLPFEGLNLTLTQSEEYPYIYCSVLCYDENKGRSKLTYDIGNTFLVLTFGWFSNGKYVPFEPEILSKDTVYVRLCLGCVDSNGKDIEIPEQDIDKILSQLKISYE